MEKYTTEFDREEFACARVEDANVSYKDLSEVCGRIRGKNADWAMGFLQKVIDGKAAVLYKRHNTKIGHRRELGGKKGRYPKKASAAILKVLKSAMANGRVRAMGETYQILNAAANRRYQYGRVAAKGRWARSDYETARIEVVLRPLESVPKGVEVTAPKKEVPKEEKPKEIAEKPKEVRKEEKKLEAHVHEAHHADPAHEAAEHGKSKEHTHEHEKGKHEAKKEEPKKEPEKKPEVKTVEKKPEPRKEEKKSDVK